MKNSELIKLIKGDISFKVQRTFIKNKYVATATYRCFDVVKTTSKEYYLTDNTPEYKFLNDTIDHFKNLSLNVYKLLVEVYKLEKNGLIEKQKAFLKNAQKHQTYISSYIPDHYEENPRSEIEEVMEATQIFDFMSKDEEGDLVVSCQIHEKPVDIETYIDKLTKEWSETDSISRKREIEKEFEEISNSSDYIYKTLI